MIHCEKHGDVELNQRVIRQTGDRLEWWPTDCPVCDKERRDERDKKEAARKKKEAAALEERKRENRIRACGVPRRFQLAGFDDKYANSHKQKIANFCFNYASGFENALETGRSLIMSGGVGTGKTHMLCAIANMVVDTHSVYYTTAMRLARMVKDTYSKDSTDSESGVIRKLISYDLLAIDELGMQFGTDAEKMILFEVINGRYEAMKPTILAANMTIEELKRYVGDRVIDRMRENGGKTLIFDWKSER